MDRRITQLMAIKGIGLTLAERLLAEGFNSYEKIASADKEELQKIPGIKHNIIDNIQSDALKLAEEEKFILEGQLNALLDDTEKLKTDILTLVQHIREEIIEVPSEESARSLRKEISRIMAAIERVEDTLFNQMKRLGKGLAKAEAKLTKVADGNAEEITQGLKKARKKLDKALE